MYITNMPKVKDYLIEDPDIPSQRFCCMSFIEPRDMKLLAKKETFMATNFLAKFLEEYEIAKEFSTNPNNQLTEEIKQKMNITFENIQDQYKSYRKTTFTQLTDTFDKKFNPKEGNTVSGIKVRGSYRSLEEAQDRANEMREYEPAAHVFVAQVGYWVPYDPENMEDVKANFREQQLNEIYGKRQQSLEKAKVDFGDRTQTLKDKTQEENKEQKQINAIEAMKAMTQTQSHSEHKSDLVIIDSESRQTTIETIPPPPPSSPVDSCKKKPQPARKVGGMRLKKK